MISFNPKWNQGRYCNWAMNLAFDSIVWLTVSSDECKLISAMSKYLWSKLNALQVGAYAEYFVKMEFTMHGFQVYTTEIDDRGIDFITRFEKGGWLQIQVKSIRRANTQYVFMPKTKFELSATLLVALVIFEESKPPTIYLIPSESWKAPNDLLVERLYEGKASKPEWGINISAKNHHLLDHYRFETTIPILLS